MFGVLALTFAQVAGTLAVPRTNTGKTTAAVVVKQSLALGIDFTSRKPGESRASRSDMRALVRASPGSWLDAQIQVADDSIAEPPEELLGFLLARREAIRAIIAALETSPPVWRKQPAEDAIPRLMPWIQLHKILLATALVEEREGRSEEADRALEASWSLGRGFPGPNVLIARILGVAAESWQAGVVRKFRAAPRSWIDRLSDDEPWRRLGGAIATEGRITASAQPVPAGKERPDVAVRAMAAVARALPGIAPCDRDALTDDSLWLHAAAVFRVDSSAEARALEALCKDVIQGNVAFIVRRTARLRVDRELSSKILELRRERAGSADGKWPAKVELASTICPGAAYRYRLSGEGMEIRFDGSVDNPEAGVVLPLEYAAR